MAVLIIIFLGTSCSEETPFEIEEVIPSVNILYPREGFKVSGNSIASADIVTNGKVDSTRFEIVGIEYKMFKVKKETAAFDFGDSAIYKDGKEYTLIIKWWGGEGTFSDSSSFFVAEDKTERITSRGGNITLFNTVPTYTSDSTRIIFQSQRTGNMELYSIRNPLISDIIEKEKKLRVIDIQNTDLNLSKSSSSEIMPFFWFATNKLLYSSNNQGNYRLNILELSTEKIDTLTKDNADSFFPSGSIDGRLVVYEREEDGNSDIWLLSMTDRLSSSLLQREGSDGHPLFSPDDATIIFHSNFNGTFDIWTIPVAGGDPTLIVDWDSDEKNPVWSPDGNHIAFTSNRAGNDDIWLYRLSDGSAVQLTSNSADEDFAVFHPTRQEILFSAFIDGNGDIFRLADISLSF